MASRKKEDSLEKILANIDKQVTARGKAVLAEVDASAEIARLTSAARKQGATMAQLTERVKRMDKKERKLKPVTRQALDIMLATFEQRREPRTTRASRKRRTPEPAGTLNAAALK
jgi:hypothetical protein